MRSSDRQTKMTMHKKGRVRNSLHFFSPVVSPDNDSTLDPRPRPLSTFADCVTISKSLHRHGFSSPNFRQFEPKENFKKSEYRGCQAVVGSPSCFLQRGRRNSGARKADPQTTKAQTPNTHSWKSVASLSTRNPVNLLLSGGY